MTIESLFETLDSVRKRSVDANDDALCNKKTKEGDARVPAEIHAQEFITWCSEQGALHTDKLSLEYSASEGLCVFAKRDIEGHECICGLPHPLVLTPVHIFAWSHFGKLVSKRFASIVITDKESTLFRLTGHGDLEQELHLSVTDCLIAFLIHEKQRSSSQDDPAELNDRSTFSWKPYVQLLPETVDTPLWWSQDEIESLLSGTNMLGSVQSQLTQCRTSCEQLLGALTSVLAFQWTDYLWAFSIVRSRCFPFLPPETGLQDYTDRLRTSLDARFVSADATHLVQASTRTSCLFPLLDFFNHKPRSSITWLTTGTHMQFMTGRRWQATEQMYNNYGAKGNEELLYGYGFCLPLDQLEGVDGVRLVLKAPQVVMDETLRQGDVQTLCSIVESVKTVMERQDQQGDETKLELVALTQAMALFIHRQDKLEEGLSVAQDFAHTTASRKHNALMYRTGQIKVLHWAFDFLRDSFLAQLADVFKAQQPDVTKDNERGSLVQSDPRYLCRLLMDDRADNSRLYVDEAVRCDSILLVLPLNENTSMSLAAFKETEADWVEVLVREHDLEDQDLMVFNVLMHCDLSEAPENLLSAVSSRLKEGAAYLHEVACQLPEHAQSRMKQHSEEATLAALVVAEYFSFQQNNELKAIVPPLKLFAGCARKLQVGNAYWSMEGGQVHLKAFQSLPKGSTVSVPFPCAQGLEDEWPICERCRFWKKASQIVAME